MDAVAEPGLISSAASNSQLLNLFATFIGKDINDPILWKPELFDDYSDYEAEDAFERRSKLKEASSVLLKSIDNVNFTDNTGQTFLHHFVEIFLNESCYLTADRVSVGFEIVKNLLDRGASIHTVDNEGFTPFRIVMENQRKDLIKLMLSQLKKICLCFVENCRDKQTTTPLHLDAADYSVEILTICLESSVDFSVHTSTNETPVIIVCKYPFVSTDVSVKVGVINMLINGGCNVNVVDSDGYSALHYAIEKQPVNLVHRLIELGADVNQPTKDHRTPLCLALQKKRLEKIEMLLKAGVDVNAEITKNVVPLMFVLRSKYEYKFVRCLIDNGADVNCRDEITGFKPLHLAMLVDNLKSVEALIERVADVNCREPRYGLTPMHLVSMERRHADELIMERYCARDTLNSAARATLVYLTRDEIEGRSQLIIASLTKSGADVNVRDSRGMTPLHYATLHPPRFLREHDVLPTLLRLGAHVNQQTGDGQLPVYSVVQMHNLAALDYLIRFGADLHEIEATYLGELWDLSISSFANVNVSSMPCEIRSIYQYMIKMNVAGLLAIDSSSFDAMRNNCQVHINLCKKYSEEVTKLKNYFIEDRISLYDWLHMNHTKARPFYLSGIPHGLKSQFPVYYEVIEARYRMVTERIPLLEPAKLAWYQITKIDLPEVCVEHILFYLSNRYLRLLASSLESNEV